MQTFHIIVYGCQMNYSDSARIKAVLSNCGRVQVDNIEQADVVILDTCSVREKSEDKVRGQLQDLRKDQKVWLTGCMIQHNLNLKKLGTTISKKLTKGNFMDAISSKEPTIIWLQELEQDALLKQIAKEIALKQGNRSGELLYVNHAFDPLFKKMHTTYPNVELFFRINDTGFLPLMMKALGYEVKGDVELINEYSNIIPHDANMLMKSSTKTAYVPISMGCSQFCAYCIVPYSRGLEKHREVEEVMKEVASHVENGAQEIVLIGQIVNKHPKFAEILRRVSDIPEVVRVRYTSPYPTFYNDEIFALHVERENICPHIHIPLQSGSSKVLKKMFRGYNRQQFEECITKIHALGRPIALTSDIIVGFTDETEEDFIESLEVTKSSKFDMVYIGIYSPRPGTYGAKNYEDNVPQKIKKERRSRLNDLLIEISANNNQKEIGTIRTMLINQIQDRAIIGYTDNMKNVIVEMNTLTEQQKQIFPPWQGGYPEGEGVTGQFIKVKIIRTEAFKLFGEIVE